MNASILKVFEATAIHTVQKTVEIVIEKTKERLVVATELKKRVEAVEKDVAALKGTKHV